MSSDDNFESHEVNYAAEERLRGAAGALYIALNALLGCVHAMSRDGCANHAFNDAVLKARVALAMAEGAPEVRGYASVVNMAVTAGLVESKSEARRLIEQRGLRIDDEVVTSVEMLIPVGQTVVMQAGKRRFARVTVVAHDEVKATDGDTT